MKRFEQIIEDQYKRLGLRSEAGNPNDDTESDNADQDEELAAAKTNTDQAEDTAHAAGMTAQQSRTDLANKKTEKSSATTAKNTDAINKMGK